MIDLILVKCNNREYEDETIQSILDTTDIHYHLTVYENYNKRRNLSTCWNMLIDRSDAEYIVLVNTDVILEDNWYSMLDHFDESTGAIGPITNKCGSPQTGRSKSEKTDARVPTSMLSGFFMAFPKAVWQEIGGFDERFKLYGEDSDFCKRMTDAGYLLYMDFDTHIYHHGGRTTSKEKNLDKIREQSRNLYKKKHG